MKITILITVAFATTFLITSCKQEELSHAQQLNDSLTTVINERESTINDFIVSFNEIEQGLDYVTEKQKVIYLNTSKSKGELVAGQRERINVEIAAINSQMEQNSKAISVLTRKLKNSATKNSLLEKTTETLENQLAEKYLELASLNDQLKLLDITVAKLQTAVDTLLVKNMAQIQTIDQKNSTLHTAYYIVGKTKELQDVKIIDKKGGLLGIGRTSKLMSNFDSNKFIRIDYTKTNRIPINSNNVNIITSHPTDSYVFNKDSTGHELITSLRITDPEKFWRASKYLVIVNN